MSAEARIRAFHGTSGELASRIVRNGFLVSRNEYDWLGDGVYFFQDAQARAWEWARLRHSLDPAVVQADIDLVDCMDLLDPSWGRVLTESYDSFLTYLRRVDLPLPRQTPGAHRLDRAVINYVIAELKRRGTVIRSVRGAFAEGAPVYPGSAIYDRAHVQVAVRDLSVIRSPVLLVSEVG